MLKSLAQTFYKQRLLRGAIALQLPLLMLLTLNTTAEESNFWSHIFNPPPPPEREGTSRGDDLCLIAPDSTSSTAIVWRDRPTLTWQAPEGFITRIEIHPMGDSHSTRSYEISSEHLVQTAISTEFSLYQLTLDHPLEPGITYEWRSYRQLGDTEIPLSRFVRFRLPDPDERDRLTAAITHLEENLAQQNLTDEPAVIERVNFFAEEHLWAEVWRELFSIPDPSPEMAAAIASTINSLCNSSTEE